MSDMPPDKPNPLTPPEVADVLRTVELRAGYIIGTCKDVREMRLEAEEIKRQLAVAFKGLRDWWHAPQSERCPKCNGDQRGAPCAYPEACAHPCRTYIAERNQALLAAAAPDGMTVTDEMVDRFLSWSLPKDFAPDCGISFSPPKTPHPTGYWPIGTNLFTADQARQMLEHLLAPSADRARKYPQATNPPLGQGCVVDPDAPASSVAPSESPLGWIVFVHADAQGYDYRIFADEKDASDVAGEDERNGEPIPLYRASAFAPSATTPTNVYKQAWDDWRSLQTGDAKKMMDDALRYRRIRESPAWYDAHGRKLWGEELDAAVDESLARSEGTGA